MIRQFTTHIDLWKSDYKSMNFEQLMAAKIPIGLSHKERIERLAFIAQELQIKGKSMAPDGFTKLPKGIKCKCSALWREEDGSFWCCRTWCAACQEWLEEGDIECMHIECPQTTV